MRKTFVSLSLLMLAGCASFPSTPAGVTVVSVAELNEHPDVWSGRRVEVSGLVVEEFENLGLYSSWQDYCSAHGAARSVIYVDWDGAKHSSKRLPRRMATVRGTFRNGVGAEWLNGPAEIVISTGAPGPGPLEDVKIVRWHGDPMPACER